MKRLSAPLILLVVAILAYGLLIPGLGFYWDDLPMSWVRYQLGPEAMTRYFSTNRPVWGLLYQLTTRLLPHDPVYWQVFALGWRWLGAVLLWAILLKVWPAQPVAALSASLFFLLYPGFNQHWVSYLYSHFFIVIACFLASFLLMLRGGVANTVLGLVLSAMNLWMLEYFFVLELARPIVLWFSAEAEVPDARARASYTLRRWAPWLVLFALAILSRLFVFNNQIYGFGVSDAFLRQPLTAAISLARDVMSSLWTATLAAWSQVVQLPNATVAGARTWLVYAAVMLASIGLVILSLWSPARAPSDARLPHAKRLLALGFLMLLLAGPPFWLTGVPVSLAFPASRAMLSFSVGAALVMSALLQLISSDRWRRIAIAALVALSAGRQFLWANDFRRDWDSHKTLFWQMTWRAPGIESGTIVMTNQALDYYADNSLSAALNWIYAPDNHTSEVDYVVFFPTNRIGGSLPILSANVPVTYDYLAGVFDGNTSRTLAFYYDPPGCARLLDPEIDPENRLIPFDGLMRQAAQLSDASLIHPSPQARPPSIYGPEPLHGWCYYFERADLARQTRDWPQVAQIAGQAFDLADYPNDPTERFVFIEGYAHTGQWEAARDQTLQAYEVSKLVVGPLLCRLWDRIERETAAEVDQASAVQEVRLVLKCQ